MKRIGVFLDNYIAGGVDSVIANQINYWPLEDKIVLICNKTHKGLDAILRKKIQRDYQLVFFPFKTITDIYLESRHVFSRFLYRLFFYYGKYAYCFLVSQKLMVLFSELNLDALFIHNGGYPGSDLARYAVFSAKSADINKIVMIVHSLADAPSKFRSVFERSIDRRIDRVAKVVCVSAASRQSILLKRNIKKNVFIVHNGVSIESHADFRHENSSLLHKVISLKKNYKILTMISSFEYLKGHEVLFKALYFLTQSKDVSYKCLVIGKGSIEEELRLQALVKKYNLEECVIFCGFRENVRDYLALTDVFVFPSVAYESFPMVILEAMLHALPIIASDVGGVKEMLIDRESGIIIPPGVPAVLSETLHALLCDAALQKTLGKKARKRVEEKFSVKHMIEQYQDLIV